MHRVTQQETDVDELSVALSTFVGDTRQMRVSFLAVLADHAAVVVLVLTEESLGVVVAVDVDLGQCVVSGWLHAALVDTRLQPRQQQLQPTPATTAQFHRLLIMVWFGSVHCCLTFPAQTAYIMP